MNKLKDKFVPTGAFHPGETLEEKLEELNMPVLEFAQRVNKPEKTIHAILNQTSRVTPEMAVAFEHVLGIPAQFWLNKQAHFDEYQAREKAKAEQQANSIWANQFPFKEMQKLGWINPNISAELSELLFGFFKVSSPVAWQNCYALARPNYRISMKHTSNAFAISAWLRRGEQLAEAMEVNTFDKKSAQAALPKFKAIMMAAAPDFFTQMQAVAASIGIKLLYVPNLPKAPIAGCARWYQNSPIIQLSARQKRYDSLWFSFMHELGHILHHGKTEMFMEDVDYVEQNAQKEAEADAFAKNQLILHRHIARIRTFGVVSPEFLIMHANASDTHPAILLGRLQHEGILAHNAFNEFRLKLRMDNYSITLDI